MKPQPQTYTVRFIKLAHPSVDVVARTDDEAKAAIVKHFEAQGKPCPPVDYLEPEWTEEFLNRRYHG